MQSSLFPLCHRGERRRGTENRMLLFHMPRQVKLRNDSLKRAAKVFDNRVRMIYRDQTSRVTIPE
jgi:hypothetical protein